MAGGPMYSNAVSKNTYQGKEEKLILSLSDAAIVICSY